MAKLITAPAELASQLHKLYDGYEKGLKTAYMRAFFGAAQLAKGEVIKQIDLTTPHVPVDTGGMKRSYEVVKEPNRVILRNNMKQAIWMEYGTKPHSAPMEPLLAWARRKNRGKTLTDGTTSKSAGKGKKRLKITSEMREQAARRLAGAAWASIKRKGTAPRKFHARASKSFQGFVDRMLRREIARMLKRKIEGFGK